jgi:hypothetical protein
MRKLISLFFVAFTICSNTLFAQAVDTSTTEKLLQYVFQKIDKSQISTGYLAEYGLPLVNVIRAPPKVKFKTMPYKLFNHINFTT